MHFNSLLEEVSKKKFEEKGKRNEEELDELDEKEPDELVTEASRPVGEELEVERLIILLPRLLRGNCWW